MHRSGACCAQSIITASPALALCGVARTGVPGSLQERLDARTVAGHLKRLDIPIGKVYGNPFYAVFGAPYLAEGEIVVVRPDGRSGYAIAGKVRLDDWAALK
jgi:hypothetical protein